MIKIRNDANSQAFLVTMQEAAEKWPGPATVTAQQKAYFVAQLLHGNSLRDLQRHSQGEAEALLLNLWQKFQQRAFSEIRIDIQENVQGEDDRIDLTVMQRQIPFITDSILNLISQTHLSVAVMLNATFKVRRDDDGQLLSIHHEDDEGPDLQADKVLHLQCDNRVDTLDTVVLRQQISDILRDVHAAVEDWRPMQGQISETINDLDSFTSDDLRGDAHEAAVFLDFLKDGNFTFLGYREHTVRREGKTTYYDVIADKSLGLLRDKDFLLFDGLITDDLIPQLAHEALFNSKPLLMVLKANRRATVHRHVHMDVLLVKKYNDKGEVIALRLFAGLFTSQCYSKPTDQIPYLRDKVRKVLERSGFEEEMHAWRSLKHVLDNYPRDELFQIDIEELHEHASGINRLNSRPDIDIFVRSDILQRYFSVLVYLPKEQYDTKLRLRVQNVLEEKLQGHEASHYITVDEKPLARMHFMIVTESRTLPDYDAEDIRDSLLKVCTPWSDRLKKHVLQTFGKREAQRLLRGVNNGFSLSYQDQVQIEDAVEDLEPLQKVLNTEDMVITLHQRAADKGSGKYRVKIYKRGDEASLSDILPILDRVGFHCQHEYSFSIHPSEGLPHVWIHDLVGTIDILDEEHLKEIEPLFADAFKNVWQGKTENDSFNELILAAGLTWREANLFRAFARYLDLARYPLGKRYISQVLAKYAKITTKLRDAFLTLHDPRIDRSKAELTANGLFVEIDHLLDNVEKLDEDRVIRSIISLIRATLRTNYFHVDADNNPVDVLVLKFDAASLTDIPKPKPFKEIFVYSTRVEAVHLRGGPIARGGIRWSDRFEDFRTEILGLVKAQMVKNAVIVPIGAKGGFICKNKNAQKTPQERQAEGIACYQIMVRGLLSITDNIINGEVIPPANTVRFDQDDPYLVVAADKGTASFSDIANKISLDHNFWLGDAFASGGSKGYDHKAMGITARGAWECIKRHFREMGKDIQNEEFTAAGVGDMSGDVFGNGMLLSDKTRLVAAFDHRHIFIDPNPDAKKSFDERKRLFEKPASSWADYDPKLISAGGGVFSRQEKSILLTSEIKELLDIEKDRVTPNDLMVAILRARVELMYFGGIGTYIKATTQTHEQVGDKGNDAIRVNAIELRCKVLGEGANLGVTQLARIEFAQHGGRINTDFIDNSGGVDTSDHEVNIKILLQPLVSSNVITEAEREKILAAMTEEVGSHVLKNNYDQSLALSLLQRRARHELPTQVKYMRALERDDLLDRKIEDLPSDDMIQRLLQRGEGLTRPELAVILAYSKMTLFKQLMTTSFLDEDVMLHQAMEYFPDLLQERFPNEVPKHKLKRDIIATEVANIIINRMGPTFVAGKQAQGGYSVDQIAKAWLITRSVFDLRTLWNEVDKLDNKVSSEVQFALYEKIIAAMEQGVDWFLTNHADDLSIEKLVPLYRDQLLLLQGVFAQTVPSFIKDQIEVYQKELDAVENLRPDIKRHLLSLPVQQAGCAVVLLKQMTSAKAEDAAKAYFGLSDRLYIPQMRSFLDKIIPENDWIAEAIDALREEIDYSINALSKELLATGESEGAALLAKRDVALKALDEIMEDVLHQGAVDLSLLTVIVKRLRRIAD